MRLIDADALVKELSGKYIVPVDEATRGVAAFMGIQMRQAINNAPTIETVPLEDYRSMEQTVYKLTQALAEAETVNNGRKPKVVTNADNLRSIQNDMQLAMFMGSVNACPYDRDDALFECEKWNGACDRCWLYWLKQEVEGDGTETLDEVEEWALG